MPIVLQEPASAPSRDQLLRGSPHTEFVRARRLARMKSLQLPGGIPNVSASWGLSCFVCICRSARNHWHVSIFAFPCGSASSYK